MTLDQALDKAAAAIDVRLEMARTQFEQSLIDNHAPEDALEDLLDWHQAQQLVWRARHLRTCARGCWWRVGI